jgi:PAS domain S-box-containing protein
MMASSIYSSRLPWQVSAAFLLCVFTLVLFDVGYMARSTHQVASRDRLERTVSAAHALDTLQALMVDAETGVRGFGIVGRATMLEPYDAARTRYRAALDNVGSLTSDDSVQQLNLTELRRLVETKWSMLDSSVQAIAKGPGSDAPGEAAFDARETSGKIAMDAIRAQVSRMLNREGLIQAERETMFQRALLTTRLAVGLATILALVFLCLLYWGLRQYLGLRARAESELSASEEKYRILTEVSPQIIWRANLSGALTYCNRQWMDYTGLTLEESMTRGSASVVHLDDQPGATAAWKTAVARVSPFEVEVRLRRASDQSYRWHLARARPLLDVGGNPVAWLGAAMDIDDRKRIEIALDLFNSALAMQVAERTEALEERSHQLRALNQNLIRVSEMERIRLARELHDELGAHLSVAQMDLTLISRGLASLGREDMSALTLRLAQTLNATTQISRRIISDLRPVKIIELGLAGALDSYCAEFERTSGIPCERNFPAVMPELVEEASVALFRIVQESLSNIVKYAHAEHIQLAMRVTSRYLELSIRDDGKGMSLEESRKKGSHGIIGIRERAEAFGGSLRIEQGIASHGTGLVITFALAHVATDSPDRAILTRAEAVMPSL